MLLSNRTHVEMQPEFDAAVVIPTLLRPSLLQAVESVFAQDFPGRVQILIGIDIPQGDPGLLDLLRAACPARMALTILDPGYSTSIRHNGLYPNRFSGALRTILTYLANSRYVAYLDDDNWWAPQHLSSLCTTIRDAEWAYSRRWFCDPETGQPLCIDDWESLGPDAGVYQPQFSGFVDPSSLMLNKLAVHDIIPFWSLAAFADGGGEDRLIFAGLKEHFRGQATGLATSYYRINPKDPMHLTRMQQMRERGIPLPGPARAAMPLATLLQPWLPSAPPPWPAASDAAEDGLLVNLLSRLKPVEILDLAAGDGHAICALALAAGHLGLTPILAATDRWDEAGFQACAAQIAKAGLADRIILPPRNIGDGLAWLGAAGLAVDLVQFGRGGADAEQLRTGWSLLRPGGVLLGFGAPDPSVERLATETGSTLMPITPIAGPPCWLIEKGGS